MNLANYLVISILVISVLIFIYFLKMYDPDNYVYLQDDERLFSPVCSKENIATYLKNNMNNSPVIWSFWNDKDKLPKSVYICLESWKKFMPRCIICLLSPKTLLNFLDKEDIPTGSRQIQFMTDIYRIMLLEKYGGLWLDSTLFLNRSIYNIWFPQTYDIGGYYIKSKTSDMNHPVFENWFISAPKGSLLIKNWKDELFKAYAMTLNHKNNDAYFNHLRKEGVDLQNIGSSYLWMHGAFLKVINNKNYKMKLYPADLDSGPFDYLVEHKWDTKSAVHKLIRSTDYSHCNVIKLRGSERDFLQSRLWLISKNSTIGHLL